jgi:hypothetical protein
VIPLLFALMELLTGLADAATDESGCVADDDDDDEEEEAAAECFGALGETAPWPV